MSWLARLFRRPAPIPPAPADALGAATLPHDAVVIPPRAVVEVEPAARFARCVAEVLNHEGGYVDHPNDPGGATNRGITLATLSEWRGRPVTKAEVKALTEAEAREIYRSKYWNAVQGDSLPAGLDLALLDFAVHSGPGRAARMFQRQLGVVEDGAIGPQTLAALRRVNAARVAGDFCRARLTWLRTLPAWVTFGKGWERRLVAVERKALEMVR